MLLKIIRKFSRKTAFTGAGLVVMLLVILPISLFILPWIFKDLNIWLAYICGLLILFVWFRRSLILFPYVGYTFNPKSNPFIKKLKKDGIDINSFDEELERFDIINVLSYKNPIIFTDNLVICYSLNGLSISLKEEMVWVYNYGANGLAYYDVDKKLYGVVFEGVDDNEAELNKIKEEMPYLRFDLEGNYQDEFFNHYDEIVSKVGENKIEYREDPESFKAKIDKEREEQLALEQAKLDEEKALLKEESEPLEEENLEENKEEDSSDNEESDIE